MEPKTVASLPRARLPPWLRTPYRGARTRDDVRLLLRELKLHTVCEQAHCPNRCECWARGTATFLILGERCTRNCRFCAVQHGAPVAPDPAEPARIAEAAQRLNLRFVVITSVTRDDLPDGGAPHFAQTVGAIKTAMPAAKVEVLTPDFRGIETDITTVLAAQPDVFNHNLETCERLTAQIRSGADYQRSLGVLASAARLAAPGTRIKSGFMLGLGETATEVKQMLADLHQHAVTILVIGQYLPPSRHHWPLARYVPPAEFDDWARMARAEFGFTSVVSRPLARSSFLAERAYHGTEVA